jgi:hypothetical protein
VDCCWGKAHSAKRKKTEILEEFVELNLSFKENAKST